MDRLSPYRRIVRNAKLGKGVTLTADEVALLSLDDAIFTRAQYERDQEAPDAKGGPD